MRPPLLRQFSLFVAALLLANLPGCGSSNNLARYTPQADVGEQALRDALTAWQNGQPTPIAVADKPRIEVVDAYRRPGQTLKEFRILGEVAGSGGRWYEVQLNLDGPAQVEQVRYVVIGINPLWVFRQADYEMLSHWDHPMPSQPAAKTAPATALPPSGKNSL
jgi:hypothetical protein